MRHYQQAQSAIEYLLLLAVVGAVVMVCFYSLLPKTQHSSAGYFNTVSQAIIGGPGNEPSPIDGGWCGQDGKPLGARFKDEKCPANLPCGITEIYRSCSCPAPAFGGKHCMDNAAIKEQMKMTCSDAPACEDCSNKDDRCLAPEPDSCRKVTSGLTACSKKACTKNRACGECAGPEPLNVAGECPGARVDVPEGVSWTVVPFLQNCSDNQVKCRKFAQPNPEPTP